MKKVIKTLINWRYDVDITRIWYKI
jgi:hypothetical protein